MVSWGSKQYVDICVLISCLVCRLVNKQFKIQSCDHFIKLLNEQKCAFPSLQSAIDPTFIAVLTNGVPTFFLKFEEGKSS